MIKKSFLFLALATTFLACRDNKSASTPSSGDTTTNNLQSEVAKLPELPSFVHYKNWEMGDPQKTQLILNVYKAWDGNMPGEMASYFADSANYDLPDGIRVTTTNKTVESKFRKWRNSYKETSNIPFSLISLRNKDLDEEWVIAWTWNKWSYTDGKKDSMLYCDNWRIENEKVVYFNSLQSRPSKPLSSKLDKIQK